MSTYGDRAPEWRGDLIDTATELYDAYGEDLGWGGIVPWPVSESIVSVESGGTNLDTNRAGATGLMQVVGTDAGSGGGWEAWRYAEVAGDRPTTAKLRDPGYNLRVGIFGLAERMAWASRDGFADWGKAGMGYFGAWHVDAEGHVTGMAYDKSDGHWTGQQYYDGMRDYVHDLQATEGAIAIGGQWDEDIWPELAAGRWFAPGGPDEDGIGWGDIVSAIGQGAGKAGGVKGAAGDLAGQVANAVLGQIVDAARAVALPALAIVGGLVLLGAGGFALTRG